jgi:hypothetical protein
MVLNQAFYQRLYYCFDCCIFHKLEYATLEQSVSVGADGSNRRTVKRMCVSECIVVVVQSVFYLRIG